MLLLHILKTKLQKTQYKQQQQQQHHDQVWAENNVTSTTTNQDLPQSTTDQDMVTIQSVWFVV